MAALPPLHSLDCRRFETPAILKKLALASRSLAELKGVAASIPNQAILINTLVLQEAKDSSAIENIVTTHDDLCLGDSSAAVSPAAKEVLRYRQALAAGFERVRTTGLLSLNTVLRVQAEIEPGRAGLRKLPGTVLKDGEGRTVYEPPQDAREIERLMAELECFWHGEPPYDADPLIRMALIHHQFESIHPFYDGNGRTGRIVSVLYLVKEGLLDIPVLYLSRFILRNKAAYYRLLQEARTRDAWEDWVLYMLAAVEQTAAGTIATIRAVTRLLFETKQRIRARHKFYSQDLINNLFSHPYTTIQFLQRDLGVSRLTAAKYLDALAADGTLRKRRIGRSNFYINQPLFEILSGIEEERGNG